MSFTSNLSILRSILGEQSAAIWTDDDLKGFLNSANITVWKIICDLSPELMNKRFTFQLGSGTSSTAAFTATIPASPTSYGAAKIIPASYGIGARVAQVLSVYESEYPPSSTYPGDTSFKKIKVTTTNNPYPVFENSNRIFQDLELPNIYSERHAVFEYSDQVLVIFPAPNKDFTYKVHLVPEAPTYIKTGATTTRTPYINEAVSADSSDFLGTEFFSTDTGQFVAGTAHLAVIFEAAYMASFVDKSLRREFAAERDRHLALMTTQPLSADEAY